MKKLYCIYDTVAEEAGQPVMINNDVAATDFFFATMENPQKKLRASRYRLYCLGEYYPTSPYISLAVGEETKQAFPYVVDVDALRVQAGVSELDGQLDQGE